MLNLRLSKRDLKHLEHEYKGKYGKKDVIAPILLILVGGYLYAREIGYINFQISYLSFIVIGLGLILLIKNLME
ncbi:MAG: hypothetical protein WC413_02925 [Candidatus Nanoarchaeia archaeon]